MWGKRFELLFSPIPPTLSLARPLPRVRHGVCTGVLALALLAMLASGKAFGCGPVAQQHFDQFGSSNVTYNEPTGSSATFSGISPFPSGTSTPVTATVSISCPAGNLTVSFAGSEPGGGLHYKSGKLHPFCKRSIQLRFIGSYLGC